MDLTSMTIAEQRAVFEATASPMPEGTEVVPVDADGVPCEWISVPSVPPVPSVAGVDPATAVVSLRGGGYCMGSLATNRGFCALLSEHTGSRVLNVGYRNAPECPCPAALDDALTAYRW